MFVICVSVCVCGVLLVLGIGGRCTWSSTYSRSHASVNYTGCHTTLFSCFQIAENKKRPPRSQKGQTRHPEWAVVATIETLSEIQQMFESIHALLVETDERFDYDWRVSVRWWPLRHSFWDAFSCISRGHHPRYLYSVVYRQLYVGVASHDTHRWSVMLVH